MQHQRFSGLGRRLRTLTGVAFTLFVSAYSGVGCSDAQSGGGAGGAGGANGCNLAVLCDGQNVATLDTCTQVKQVLTTCPKSCHQGDCVDCVPGAGAFTWKSCSTAAGTVVPLRIAWRPPVRLVKRRV